MMRKAFLASLCKRALPLRTNLSAIPNVADKPASNSLRLNFIGLRSYTTNASSTVASNTNSATTTTTNDNKETTAPSSDNKNTSADAKVNASSVAASAADATTSTTTTKTATTKTQKQLEQEREAAKKKPKFAKFGSIEAEYRGKPDLYKGVPWYDEIPEPERYSPQGTHTEYRPIPRWMSNYIQLFAFGAMTFIIIGVVWGALDPEPDPRTKDLEKIKHIQEIRQLTANEIREFTELEKEREKFIREQIQKMIDAQEAEKEAAAQATAAADATPASPDATA